MLQTVYSTLSRDFSALCLRASFWAVLALWTAICALIFFSSLEDFLAIQPSLRAKNFRYGVTDIVIVPYFKLLGSAAIVMIASFCSRLFYHEKFSVFSPLLRSTQPSAIAIIIAKITYIKLLALVLLTIMVLPVIGTGFFFYYNAFRVIMTLFAWFMVLLSAGMLSMVLSLLFAHSIIVTVLAMSLVITSEIAVRLIVEPTWLAPIIAFFSPIAHLNRISTGVVTVSDGVFFGLLALLLLGIAVRQFNNTYLTTS